MRTATTFTFGTDSVDQGQEYRERRYRFRVVCSLTRRAHAPGSSLLETADLAASSTES